MWNTSSFVRMTAAYSIQPYFVLYYIAVSGRRHDWAEIGRQRHGRQCQRGLRLLGLAAPAAVPEVTMSSVRSSGEAEGALLELGAGMKIYFRTVRHHTNPQQLC